MTDAEYFNNIANCMRAGDGKGAISVISRIRAEARAEASRDEYHTMDELYTHRMALNAALVNQNPGASEKAKYHHDGTMFDGGYFIVVTQTPAGPVSYHYKLEHWDKFQCKEAEKSSIPFDGHTPDDCINRLLSVSAILADEPKETQESVCHRCGGTKEFMGDPCTCLPCHTPD